MPHLNPPVFYDCLGIVGDPFYVLRLALKPQLFEYFCPENGPLLATRLTKLSQKQKG